MKFPGFLVETTYPRFVFYEQARRTQAAIRGFINYLSDSKRASPQVVYAKPVPNMTPSKKPLTPQTVNPEPRNR